MSTLFEWNDSYSVKVKALDNQHKKLFDLINELHTAMKAGRGKVAAGEVLRRLIDYTVYHFSAEEQLMEKHKFPDLVAHRAEHKVLTDKVLAFKKDFDADTAPVTVDLMNFLQQWLLNHIQRVDQRYSDFMNGRGVYYNLVARTNASRETIRGRPADGAWIFAGRGGLPGNVLFVSPPVSNGPGGYCQRVLS